MTTNAKIVFSNVAYYATYLNCKTDEEINNFIRACVLSLLKKMLKYCIRYSRGDKSLVDRFFSIDFSQSVSPEDFGLDEEEYGDGRLYEIMVAPYNFFPENFRKSLSVLEEGVFNILAIDFLAYKPLYVNDFEIYCDDEISIKIETPSYLIFKGLNTDIETPIYPALSPDIICYGTIKEYDESDEVFKLLKHPIIVDGFKELVKQKKNLH